MIKKCFVCAREGNMHKHHIIHGHGKTKVCQTKESLIDICHDCHKQVHNEEGSELDHKMKLKLQAIYFKKGYTEEQVCQLLGRNLFLVGDKVWGKGCEVNFNELANIFAHGDGSQISLVIKFVDKRETCIE